MDEKHRRTELFPPETNQFRGIIGSNIKLLSTDMTPDMLHVDEGEAK